jgi:hypothetical protein
MKGLRLKLGFTAKANAVVGGAPAITFDDTFNANFSYNGTKLVATQTGAGDQMARATQSRLPGTGTHSFTITITTKATSFIELGIADTSIAASSPVGGDKSVGYWSDGSIHYGASVTSSLPTYTTGDVITVYQIGNLVGFAKNGTPVNSFDTTTGANGTDITSGGAGVAIVTGFPVASGNGTGNVFTADFASW